MKNTFKKSERLTSKITMEAIFEKGNTLKKFPFILKYLPYSFQDGELLKIVISVPKRRIKKAFARNRIRRLIKEAYRLNKHTLKTNLLHANKSVTENSEPTNNGLALFLIYTGKENPDYTLIEEKIKLILKELNIAYLKAIKQN